MRTGREVYRIDFALILLTGNVTRYLTTRPLVEADPTVMARWFPIRTWFATDPLRVLPGALRVRLRHFLDSLGLYLRRPADAVVIHAFETYFVYSLFHRLLRRKQVIVNNPDGKIPSPTPGLRGWLRRNAVASTRLIVPWSKWAMESIRDDYPELNDDRLLVLHPGIDLSHWPFRTSKEPSGRYRILFVGGDLLRKGADTLLDAFLSGLSETCELYIATQSGYIPRELKARLVATPHVRLYLDLSPGSDGLEALYKHCDVFVLPTNSDVSSWVALEAMATGLPVIITPSGGILDIVQDGETGLLIPPKDPAAIVGAVNRLRLDPGLCNRLATQARAHVDANYNAQKNTARLLSVVKALIDERRRERS